MLKWFPWKNNDTGRISKHKFPKDPIRQRLWINAPRSGDEDGFASSKFRFVRTTSRWTSCESTKGRILHKHAIPSIPCASRQREWASPRRRLSKDARKDQLRHNHRNHGCFCTWSVTPCRRLQRVVRKDQQRDLASPRSSTTRQIFPVNRKQQFSSFFVTDLHTQKVMFLEDLV